MKRPIVALALSGLVIASTLVAIAAQPSPGAGSAAEGITVALDTIATAAPGKPFAQSLALQAGSALSLVVSLEAPETLEPTAVVRAVLADAAGPIAQKRLHLGDGDFYLHFQPRAPGSGSIRLEVSGTRRPVRARVRCLAWAPGSGAAIEREPNDTPAEAVPIPLGQPVFASADEQSFYPLLEEDPARWVNTAPDWYRVEQPGPGPKLVYFHVDLLVRDNIPVDVSVFTLRDGQPVPYEKGIDPVSPPHEVQALPGNKFTARVLDPGTYYVRVTANHPAYQLRTTVYDVPPFADPRQAVRVAQDYLAGAGDSWHANTPRNGGLLTRVANSHSETKQCVACHPTHFTTRAILYSARNGYPIEQRSQVQFLCERLANTPRPFYGHPGAVWARMISASANVLSRAGMLVTRYQELVNPRDRWEVLRGIAGYLELYYRGRSDLPNDESNGNTPLVSTYEVAFYSWQVFDTLARRSGDERYARLRDHVGRLLEQVRHKNVTDLCWHTIALATIDRDRYRPQIEANVQRLLSLQRPSGQWSREFDPSSPEVEFQTGHALYALAVAGAPAEHPQVKKGLEYLLRRQQVWGGWFDPLQSYENFRTPFRETQFAVLALAEYLHGPGAQGWSLAPPASLDARHPAALLAGLDRIWEPPTRAVYAQVLAAARHPEPLVRQAAVAALGRVGEADAASVLIAALGDESKLVREAAAWACRQLINRGVARDAVAAALADRRAVVRRGATRVFSQHFAASVGHAPFLAGLLQASADRDPVVRLQALQALWQWWYWSPSDDERTRIETAILARLRGGEHPWVERNAREALYIVLDDNVRYLYANWIPLLAQPEDREKAIAGHHASSLRQARLLAEALTRGDETLRRNLLRGIVEFHLRPGAGRRYVRIGNDVEQIKFYPAAAEVLEPVLARLMEDRSPEVRAMAALAAYTLRDNPLKSVPRAVRLRLLDREESVRKAAEEFAGALPLSLDDPTSAATVAAMLASPHPEAQRVGLADLQRLGAAAADHPALRQAVRDLVLTADNVAAWVRALTAARLMPPLAEESDVRSRVRDALVHTDPNVLRTAAELVLAVPGYSRDRRIQSALVSLFETAQGAVRLALLDLASVPAARRDIRVIDLVAEALQDPDDAIRVRAITVLQQARELAANPAIRLALAQRRHDPNPGVRQAAEALYQGRQRVASEQDITRLLDFDTFVEKIQPIFLARGPDGSNCAGCHATHSILRLAPPREGGWTRADAELNYRSTLKVIDLDAPERSLLLQKPLSEAEGEGVVGSDRITHGGGIRWPNGIRDEAYQTILAWLNGARAARR